MKLSFKPETITKNLLLELTERSRSVLERRYGLLNKGVERMTLEAIGQVYGITRERVRQIENTSLEQIRKSKIYEKSQSSLKELEDAMVKYGGVVHEDEFLKNLSSSIGTQNHINFLLVIGEPFVKLKEDDHFHHRWTVDEELADQVHMALHNLYKNLSEEELVSEGEMILRFMDHLKETVTQSVNEEVARRWLSISKHIKKNPLGDWGLAHSHNIKTRGMRDMAYLVIKKAARPLHFTEVAQAITKDFNRRAHIATTHNELIKDARFVLVGRGLYALSEWGYSSGVVRDVIKKILKQHGPLNKDEIVKKVREQRHVKDNTIYVNLQNNSHFKKDSKGRYLLV
ncbi:MAG TPA: sigma factor-like helix-turn-helix DNA-binding protein [Candidatus Paceibacterota bacterium]